jgi:hypothetical protein
MAGAATALSYHHATRQLFVGLETGMVSEFVLADDFNRMDHIRGAIHQLLSIILNLDS